MLGCTCVTTSTRTTSTWPSGSCWRASSPPRSTASCAAWGRWGVLAINHETAVGFFVVFTLWLQMGIAVWLCEGARLWAGWVSAEWSVQHRSDFVDRGGCVVIGNYPSGAGIYLSMWASLPQWWNPRVHTPVVQILQILPCCRCLSTCVHTPVVQMFTLSTCVPIAQWCIYLLIHVCAWLCQCVCVRVFVHLNRMFW